MISTLDRDGGVAGCLRQDKGALQDSLRMKGKAPRGPVSLDLVLAHRFRNVGNECLGVTEDAFLAGVANVVVGREGFLHGRAGIAGKSGGKPLQQLPAKVDIGKNAVKRVRVVMIGRRGEQAAGRFAPVVCGRDGECVLAFEMMEEGTLGDARFAAQLINRRGCIPLRAHEGDRGVEEFRAGVWLDHA